MNVKKKEGAEIVRKLIGQSDVVIEPFRRGVMESLGLGPDELIKINPSLVYARLTGFGQTGPYSAMAGHDINYVAMSGALSFLGRVNEKPTAPVNLLADFGGGGLMCALGILAALVERGRSGRGQVVDAAMVDGTAYLSSWLFRSQSLPIWGNTRGQNILDTGSHFYDTYETSDGKYMAVGALEPHFYNILLEKLHLQNIEHFGNFEANKEVFTKIFKTKTQAEWCAIFDGTDACVTPVLTPEEAAKHPHNVERQTFASVSASGEVIPEPAPKLSRTPATSSALQPAPHNGAHSRQILLELSYTEAQVHQLSNDQIVLLGHEPNSKI